jgi:hypothetical protein
MNANALSGSPAHAPVRAARASMEAALPLLREVPHKLDRSGVAALLARAMKSIYTVLDTRVEAPAHHAALVACAESLRESRRLLEPDRAARKHAALDRACALLDEAIAAVVGAEREVADVQLARRHELRGGAIEAPPLPVRPMRACAGVPQLHAPKRSTIAMTISLDATTPIEEEKPAIVPPPKPKTIEELRAAAAAAKKPAEQPAAPSEHEEDEEGAPAPDATSPALIAFVPAAGEREAIRRIARDCLEDLAILSTLRQPIPTETWLDQAPFEQRLLANLDAFVSLGESALDEVALFHAEAAAPDAARAFAVAFTLGCIEGTDTVDVAIAILRESAVEEHRGFATGFVLAPSPAIDSQLAELLGSPRAELAGLAVDVLRARGALPFRAAADLIARGDVTLTTRVARAFGRAGPQKQAVEALVELASRTAPDALFFEATESLLRRGHGAARDLLREALADATSSPVRAGGAAMLLAMSGRATDVDLLIATARRVRTPDTTRALGFFGSVAAVPALSELLSAKEEGVAAAAAASLARITGQAFDDGAAWDAWWAKTGARLDARVKLLRGAPFTPLAIADELASKAASPNLRHELALALTLATGETSRFSPGDWVARQKEHLAEWRARLPRVDAGAWSYFGAVTSK